MGCGRGECFIDFGISVSKNNVHYFNAIPSNGIYEIDMHDLVPNNNSIYKVSTKRAKRNLDSTYRWHCRLAHISKKRIEKLQQEGLLRSTDDESFDQCVSCLSGKMTRKSFLHCPERATDLLGIIHIDVCGPLRHVSRQGASYFITFTDDYSRYGYVYLLKHKHEVFEIFKVFKNEVENLLGKTIKALRSDRGGEYIAKSLKIILKMSEHAFSYGSTKKVDKTPCELWYGKVLNLSYLKETMGYYFYFPPENKIVVARYAEFFEKNLITQEVSGRAKGLEEIQDEDTSPSEITSEIPMEVEGFEPPQEEVIPIRRSERTHRAPKRLCLNVEVEEHSLGDLNEPTSYKAAMLDSESDKWIDAMNAEMQSMIDTLQQYKGLGSTFSTLSYKGCRPKVLRVDNFDPKIVIWGFHKEGVVGTLGLRIRTRGDTMSGVENGTITVVEVIIGDESGRKWAGIRRLKWLEWAGIRRLEWLIIGKRRLE
ncbi:retrotransposon protein, putative, ty1-copia subclass [Tanacetum coccineum]|uniref:Retrotransposon protein, putative, ty1-copia subclass n=1 Tax=Tanacetum coccineum TaxID=301880 RepID=A0ABQ5ASA0_9ASTR